MAPSPPVNVPSPALPPRQAARVEGQGNTPHDVEAWHSHDWDLPPPVVPIHDTPVGGRLGIFWRNWTILEDPFVTNILRTGYKLPLTGSPPLTNLPRSREYSRNQHLLLQTNITTLLAKEAIEIVSDPDHHLGYYSPIFLVPKKNSDKMRMIHNMAVFNDLFLDPPPHFRMVSLEQLRSKLSPQDWLVSLDLQDAYLHVPIYEPHRKYLRFVFDNRHYQWKVLPFGISTAPWLFTRITAPITRFLHLRSIQFDPYIDDCLMSHPVSRLLRRHRDCALQLLRQLGWIINLDKSHLDPTQELTFIGGFFRTNLDLVQIPRDRWEKILRFAHRGLAHALTLREWQSLLGLLTSAQDLTLRGRLMLRPLQRFLCPHIQADDTKTRFALPLHLHSFLRWWTVESNVCVGTSLTEFSHQRELFVDASLQGWGAHLEQESASGLWSVDQAEWHSNNLELQAVILAIRHWLPLLRNSNLLIATDNSTVVWLIRNQGTTGSSRLLDQTFQLFHLVDENRINIRARHIPGVQNVLADALSRPDKPSPTEWMLHPEAFLLLCRQVHRPLVDLFATRFNHQLPVYVSPIPDPAAWSVDALSLPWEGLDAYAFPPPVLMPKVLAKIRQTTHLRLTLVAPFWPARTWFPELSLLAEGNPLLLPPWPQLLKHPHSHQFHPDPEKFHLAVWTIFRKP